MNFPDDVVEKVAKALHGVPNWSAVTSRTAPDYAKAALSSLTLADLMQVDEVKAEREQQRAVMQQALVDFESLNSLIDDNLCGNIASAAIAALKAELER